MQHKQLKLQDARHFHVSCKDGTGIQDLIKHLRRVVIRLPHVQQEVPQSYLDLERVLQKSIIAHHVPYEVVPLSQVIISCHLDPVPVQMDEDQVPSTIQCRMFCCVGRMHAISLEDCAYVL